MPIPVFTMPILLFTTRRSSCSRCSDPRVHDGPKSANAWLLERKWPARYGPQIRVTVEKTLNDMLEALKSNLDAETFVRVVKVLSQHGEQEQLQFEPEAAETVLLNPERDA